MAKKRITELATETTLKDGQYVAIDHTTDGTKKLNLGAELTDLKEDLDEDVADLKSVINGITGNQAIPYNYPNSFFYTQGATWNPAAPSSDNSWDAAVVDCSPGDIFTVSGIGGASPKIWAFADAENNILLRKENSTVAITNEVIVVPANASKLILNNKKSVYADAISYYGKLLRFSVDENTENIITKIGNVKSITETYGAGQFFNLYFGVSPVDGDIALVRVNSYSGTKLSTIKIVKWRSNNDYTVQIGNAKIGRTYPVLLDSNDKKIWIQLARSEAETATTQIDFACSDSGGVAETIVKNFKPVFFVEKDGSGEFDKLVDAVQYATKFFDSTVYVGAGTWNVISEFGKTYMESVGSTQRGLYLKNRIHLIFSSNAVVSAMYDGFDGNIDDDTVEWFSIFNSGEYGFTLENLTSISRNIRYPVHDERSQTTDEPYKNHYLNCIMVHSNEKYDQAQGKSGYAQCIGGGLGTDGHIIIEGCVFENTYRYSADAQGRKRLVSYHVNNKAGATGRSTIEIKGCFFRDTGTIKAGYMGTNTDVSTMLVHDNSLGAEPFVEAEIQSADVQNIEMIAWNNEIRTA